MNCQIVHDSFPARGFSDPYLIRAEGRTVGYGLVANRHDPDTVDEFHVLPDFLAAASSMFRQLLATSNATKIRAQSNDRMMLLMLYDCATTITSDTILFEDSFATRLLCAKGVFRKLGQANKEKMFEHKHEPAGEWMIECDGVAVATGGVLFHYNPPYGDLYMEVHESYRRQGFGSYLLQELKRITYEQGKIPAARCSASNIASRNALEKAGMLPCARVLVGDVAK
jgi:GNAT superfamily N-acetyltransferase